jgi:hypothetical protein
MSDKVVDQEQRIQLAIAAVDAKEVRSLRQAALLFNVPRSTLGSRFKGRLTHQAAAQHLQRLTPAEEDSIVKAIYQLDAWGWPMSISAIEHLATQLLLAKHDDKPLGKNWYYHFLSRHPDLRTRRSRAMDQSRKDALDHQTADQWFKLFQTTLLKYSIAVDDIYNMDEKGCMKGIGDSTVVIVPRRKLETPTAIQPGNRDWVSIVECISANGYLLPPFIIFEGVRIQQSWIPDDLDDDVVIQVSPNGWTDCNIALRWIRHFDQHTRRRTVGTYRLLILDGHASHVSPQFVEYCDANNIVPLCLPPHSTHELQPLDVGVFGPLAQRYRQLVTQNALFGATRIDNYQFLILYPQARKTMPKNIASGWRGACLVPFNPDKILARYRPTTPPFVSFTDRHGRRVDITATGQMAMKIDSIVEEVSKVCNTPLRQQVVKMKEDYLTLQADCRTLEKLNQELVKKKLDRRKKGTRKHFGEARVLTVAAMRAQMQERKAAEIEASRAKARRQALRGVVGFAKKVNKELPAKTTIFE